MHLASDAIYAAALDGAAFQALPGILAGALGARSAVLHWTSGSGEGELVHSGHFTDAHLDMLDNRFAGHDLWANALQRPSARNRAWCCHALVPERIYSEGRLYNDWVRSIGDDTFHALGAVIDAGDLSIEIGLHRARRQGQFVEADRHNLETILEPMRRAMLIRAKLAKAHEASALAEAALNATGETVFVLRPDGRLAHANAAGEALLVEGDVLSISTGKLKVGDPTSHRAFERALALASERGTGSTLAIASRLGCRYTVSLDPLMVGAQMRIMVLIHSPTHDATARATRASALYGLSATESAVAAMIGAGRSAQEISVERGTSILTVRGQIKSIMAKMGVHRQSEVAAALTALTRP